MSLGASAPGKIVLSGEYAVLNGAPAVCMAVDRRAVATVRGEHSTGDSASSLVQAVMMNSRADGVPDGDTRAFMTPAGEKLGLGSSAALTVAMLAALEREKPDLDRAIHIHRTWQGGTGSGVDVACSLVGGLIEYTMPESNVLPLRWPPGLAYRVIWSGASSSTGEKLARFSRATPQPSAERLVAQAASIAGVWRTAAADQLLLAYGDYIEALRAFSIDHALGIFDAGHDAITNAAAAHNVVYKPCGAGGGDIGIAMSTDETVLDDFVRQQQLSVIQCSLDSSGVLIHSS